MFKNRFCYKILDDKILDEKNNDGVVYAQIIIDTKKEVSEELKKTTIESIRIGLAKQLEVDEKYLISISESEYDLNNEEEE